MPVQQKKSQILVFFLFFNNLKMAFSKMVEYLLFLVFPLSQRHEYLVKVFPEDVMK